MYIPYQLATSIQDDRLRTAERRRLGRPAREQGARGARFGRSTRRDIVRAFRPRGTAAAMH
jgi:hypothetical protein